MRYETNEPTSERTNQSTSPPTNQSTKIMSFQAYIDSIQEKTGKTPADFKQLAEEKGLLRPGVKAGEFFDWLKQDFDLGRGHAMALYSLLTADTKPKLKHNEKLDKHFGGGKSAWRTAFDQLLDQLKAEGKEVEADPKDSYISLLKNRKKFAVVQVVTERMDVGMKLKGVDTTDRLEPAGKWNEMVTHRVRLSKPEEVDAELIGWLRTAWEQSGGK